MMVTVRGASSTQTGNSPSSPPTNSDAFQNSCAPSPMKNGKPAPVTFAPRGKSIRLPKPLISQCGTASLETASIEPYVAWTTFCSGVLPSGTVACGMFGKVSMAA